jgi:hypothetical protein
MRSSVAGTESQLSSPTPAPILPATKDLSPDPIGTIRFETHIPSWTEEEEEVYHDASSDSDYNPNQS